MEKSHVEHLEFLINRFYLLWKEENERIDFIVSTPDVIKKYMFWILWRSEKTPFNFVIDLKFSLMPAFEKTHNMAGKERGIINQSFDWKSGTIPLY